MRRLILVAVGAALCAACTQAPARATQQPASPTAVLTPTPLPYAALVNGTPIPRDVYERRLAVQKALIQGLDFGTETGQAIEAQLSVDTLNQLIDYYLIKQRAAALGVTVTPEDIDQRLNAPAGGEAWDVMRSSLSSQSADPDYFRSLVEQQLLAEKLIDRVVTPVPETAEQVRIRRIALETEADARAAQADLAAGQDFAQVAQRRSIDPESAPRGGDVGYYPRGIVAPEVEQVAFSLPVGAVSEPFKTPLGWEIIQVAEKSANRPIPPEYRQLIRERQFSDWLRQLRREATIEYSDAKG